VEQAVPALLGLVSGATQQANKKETHAQYKIQMYCLLPPSILSGTQQLLE